MTSPALVIVKITVVAGLLTGCSATDPGSPAPSPSATGSSASASTPAGTATPGVTTTGSADATASRVVLTRTGGIAGRKDTVTVEPDGRWTATDRTGASRTGQLAPADLDRLRALAGTATQGGGTGTPDARCADTFTYQLTVGASSARWTDCPTGPQPAPAASTLAQLLLKATTTG